MSRIALVAPTARLREALAVVADAGVVELAGPLPPAAGEAVEALRRLERNGSRAARPQLAPERPDLAALEKGGCADVLAGEVELERHAEAAHGRGSFSACVGWTPTAELAPLGTRLAAVDAVAVELQRPPWVDPPTLIGGRRLGGPFRGLVETYAPARYEDLDPTLFATVSFVLMFGMMFGDLGQGLLLAGFGLALRLVRRGPLAPLRRVWQLPFLGGLAAAAFGILYGECFGPTGMIAPLWLDPVDEPIPLLVAAVLVGAALLAQSYAIGIVNRWREQGPAAALIAPSGIAGTCVFLGAAAAAGGIAAGILPLQLAGGVTTLLGLALLAAGFVLEAGRGPLAVTQAAIETIDAVVRVGASAISFTRLAAFGLMHAALGAIVWDAASGLWGTPAGSLLAVCVFLLGMALAFSLELLVTGIQALRLEYYELFSRVFSGEGRAFAPWHIPLAPKEGS